MFDNLRLRQRILLGYLAPLLLLLVALGVVFANLEDAARSAAALESSRSAENEARDVALAVSSMQRAARGYLLSKEAAALRRYEENQKRLLELVRRPTPISDAAQQALMRRMLEASAESIEHTGRMIELVDAGRPEAALAYFRDDPELRRSRDEVAELIPRVIEGAAELRRQQQQDYDASIVAVRRALLLGGFGAVVVAILVAVWMAGALSRKISAYALQLAAAASEIAATVTEHERTASLQAAAANQTSATIEELSASSRQTAEQAANAAGLAERASRGTDEGGATARRTRDSMDGLRGKIEQMADHILRLSEQSAQIGNIAVLVKDLAGEINMLALNASVEAARAGENGKGFAVVASEVRKLADQSRKSAEQTAALIAEIQKATNASIMMTEDSSRTVADVSSQAEQVGSLFEQLAGLVADVSVSAQQVMLNVKQQASAFGQVAEATTSISAGTRETAAGITQTKIAVEQLNQAAQALKAMA